MALKKFALGALETGVYLSYDENSKEAWLIDSATDNLAEVFNYIEKNQLDFKGVIYTHGHYDHIMGLDKIAKYKDGITIAIGIDEYEYLLKPNLNLSSFFDKSFILDEKTEVIKLKENDNIGFFKVINSPGHTKGGISLLNEKTHELFVGDTIFYESYGRTDLPGGNFSILAESIEKILLLDEEIEMFPGHGESITVGQYKKWWEKYKKYQ